MSRKETIHFLLVRTLGNFLVLFAIFALFATFGPSLYYELSYRIAQQRGVKYKVETPKTTGLGQVMQETTGQSSISSSGFAAVLAGPTEQVLTAKDPEFSILIPKLGASAKIFPNIDSTNPDIFLPVLKEGIAHAKGTVFPGMKGNVYLFAHSTDNFWDVGQYNAVFYLLKDLSVGDEVVVFFRNKRYNYQITDSKIVDPTDTSYLVKSHEGSDETLILQTCWPPGTTWKRIMVFAKRK